MASGKLAVEKRLFSHDEFSDYDDYDIQDVSAVHPAAIPRTSRCKLADLPPELHRTIIDFVRHDLLNKNETKSRKEPRITKPLDLAKRTHIHPGEDRIRKRCAESVQNLTNWGSTSHRFRRLLAPYLFNTVHLTNEERSGFSVAALSQSPYANNVKELSFRGIAHVEDPVRETPPASPDINTWYMHSSTILPDSVASVLSSLKRFPNLDTISIELPYERQLTGDSTDSEVLSAERITPWRALIAKSWGALVRNGNIHLKTLDINRLGPVKVSTFKTSAFRAFLAQFKSFKLSIWGMERISQESLYKAPMSMLDAYFFDNLSSTTNFVFKAPVEGRLGLKRGRGGNFHTPLKLRNDQMPNLKTVFLKYIFICPELIDFLVGHQKTLESLSLHKCSASTRRMARNGIPWKDLFDCLYDSRFEEFRHLDVHFTHMPMTHREEYPDVNSEDEDAIEDERELEATKQARLRYMQDEHLRIFPYTWLLRENGICVNDYHENFKAFERGEDQASYDRLMRKISGSSS